jgi:hypothetical protein
MVQCVLGETWNSDLDIYTTPHALPTVRSWIVNEAKQLPAVALLPTSRIQSITFDLFLAMNFLSTILAAMRTSHARRIFKPLSIDLIVAKLRVSPEELFDDFDFMICKASFNGFTFSFVNPIWHSLVARQLSLSEKN